MERWTESTEGVRTHPRDHVGVPAWRSCHGTSRFYLVTSLISTLQHAVQSIPH